MYNFLCQTVLIFSTYYSQKESTHSGLRLLAHFWPKKSDKKN